MNEDKWPLDFLYLNHEKIVKTTLVFGIFFILFFISFNINSSIVIYLINIIIIMICFELMIILYTTTKFADSKFLLFSYIIFFIIGLLNVMNITLQISSGSNIQQNYNIVLQNMDICSLAESIYIHLAVNTIDKKYSHRRLISIHVFSLLAIISIFYMLTTIGIFRNSIEYITQSISILILIVPMLTLRKFSYKNNNEFNFFIIYVYTMSFSFIIHLLYLILNAQILFFLFNIVRLGAYLIMGAGLLDKFLDKPYKTIFNDIYWHNMQLEEFNKRIYLKNMTMSKIRESIERRENDYKKLFDGMPLPMVIINNSTNRIMFANNQFIKMFKIENLKDIINKSMKSIVYKNESTVVYKDDCINYDGLSEINGEVAYFEIRQFYINNNEDESILILSNVTEKIKFETMKESINQKRLEEKMRRTFLSTISHDLKTPINVIYSATQLYKYLLENNDFEVIRKYNLINKDNCMTLIRLANNIIDTSKINFDYLKPQMSRYNIVDIIEETIQHLVEYARDKNLELIFDTEEEEIFVLCDRNFIERIILNLISNSIKYSDEGEIKVYLRCYELVVAIEVSDQGRGISSEYMKRAFGKFNSKDRSKIATNQSSGLGLYVVKNLVELQGGQVSIESGEYKGTKVVIKFTRELV
ncbi:PAS domain-containing sensor histidine kinase [Clostridium folliculivorans]|uniref:sensor histidine kinase n=1 Tax=Clostridium folliculivorans TaxID=2886038 RepID=UPI0021C3848D|nr:PAS domain-containing sensor histidine kinase [Clostridium folliculivorans]GKU28513.1 two-component sensor kinase [Clostridium folliculivorans]